MYFENVGGAVLDAVLPLLNRHARIPLCGFIAHYNQDGPAAGKDRRAALMATLLSRRVRMEGFIILDHYATRFAAFRRDMGQWVDEGRVVLGRTSSTAWNRHRRHSPACCTDATSGSWW